jgi:acid phosphatase type 7
MRKRNPRVAVLLLVLVVGFAAAWVGLDYAARPRILVGPMVQLVTSAGFTVVWQQHPDQPARMHVLDATGHELATAVAAREGEFLHASVTGLRPGETYVYRLAYDLPGGREGSLAESTTKTAAPPGRPFRFVAFADTGDGSMPQYRIARTLAGYRPDLIIHAGDLVYPYGRRAQYALNFFRPNEHFLPSVPFYPCLGNHDVRDGSNGQPLLDTFVLPTNGEAGRTERDYWFDYGDVRFIAFDCNLDGPQIAQQVVPWLERVLAAARGRYKVVYYHEPIYTSSRYTSAEKLRTTVAPLFDRYGVELVINGHNHLYERTRPIRGDRIAPDGRGTVYITSGAGGAHLYKANSPRPEYLAASICDRHSFTVVDVGPDMLQLRQIDEDGQQIDETFIPRLPASFTTTATSVN